MKRQSSSYSVISDCSTSSRVSFSDDVGTKYIDVPEKESAWYSVNELQEFRRDISEVVFAMRSRGIIRDTDTTCTHGLESQVYMSLTRARKEIALSAVLEVQDSQIQADHDVNEEHLADVYFKVTRGNQLSAMRRARKHAKEVQGMLSW